MSTNKAFAVILLFLCIGFLSAQKTKAVVTYSVCGKVMVTEPYCGGAQPEQGEYELLTAPRPYSGKVFYVRKGDTNSLKQPIVASFTINSTGNFCVQLPKGNYILLQKEQVKKLDTNKYRSSENYQVSQDCLVNWWKTPYYKLKITNDHIQGLEFNFHHQCFVNSDIPCIGYFGPMPP